MIKKIIILDIKSQILSWPLKPNLARDMSQAPASNGVFLLKVVDKLNMTNK